MKQYQIITKSGQFYIINSQQDDITELMEIIKQKQYTLFELACSIEGMKKANINRDSIESITFE